MSIISHKERAELVSELVSLVESAIVLNEDEIATLFFDFESSIEELINARN